MLSIDTNLFLYSLNADCEEFDKAREFLDSVAHEEVLLCELVLVELYLLLRNPAVVDRPCSSPEAASICQTYRENPRWRLVDAAPIMDRVWTTAATVSFPRTRIIDARLAYTLQHHGTTRFATRNTRDFRDLGFSQLLNPID